MVDYMNMLNASTDDDYASLVIQSELVKRTLVACMFQPGASVTITVKRKDGNTAIAHLYDHAALVQGLIDALEYFQSEL